MRHLLVLGVVAGVGFTMALFIAQLAFTDGRLLSAAQSSACSPRVVRPPALALVLGRLLLLPRSSRLALRESADEAERSTEA